MMRPRVVGEWIGRAEEDADPLAAEMLRPPVPRVKNAVCRDRDGLPLARLVFYGQIQPQKKIQCKSSAPQNFSLYKMASDTNF